jgi:hypothetical protein
MPEQAQQNQKNSEPTFDIVQISEETIKNFEGLGATDIIVKRDKITTPNGGEGLKTFGSLVITQPNTNQRVKTEYILVFFANDNVLQQVIITWPDDDNYAEEVVERIVNSIEVVPDELQEKEN